MRQCHGQIQGREDLVTAAASLISRLSADKVGDWLSQFCAPLAQRLDAAAQQLSVGTINLQSPEFAHSLRLIMALFRSARPHTPALSWMALSPDMQQPGGSPAASIVSVLEANWCAFEVLTVCNALCY